MLIVDLNHESVLVATNIENNAVVLQNARVAIHHLHISRRLPFRVPDRAISPTVNPFIVARAARALLAR
jgi:hypothetical protein